jgi:Xaa-Pro aminopeptidase
LVIDWEREKQMIKKRLARLRAQIQVADLDGLLVTLPANRRYLSGFQHDDGQWGESSGALLVTPNQALILTDFRYALSAKEQAPYFTTCIYPQGLDRELVRIAGEARIRRLGFESDGLLVSTERRLAEALKGVELIPTSNMVSSLRHCKDPGETRLVERSLALMEKVLAQTLKADLVGKTERELALGLIRATEDAGAEEAAFAPIVASGPKGAEPHATPGPRKIKPGDPVVFDVGAKLDGYISDISRTVVAGGLEQADQKFLQVYPVVRRAQMRAIAEIRPGMTGKEADAIAREVIAEAGFGAGFGHSLGHGVGLATHEAPSLGPNSKDRLEAGMIFTIEPGIYLPGWGGVRLEQMVELTSLGCRLLNQLDDFYALD